MVSRRRQRHELAELAHLAEEAKFPARLVFRKPGQPVPVPSVVHWKVGHFSAIVGQANGRYRVEDTLSAGQTIWVTQSGARRGGERLFPRPGRHAGQPGWRTVERAEADGVWGKGGTMYTRIGGRRRRARELPELRRAARSAATTSRSSAVSITLSDTPVGYDPPIGPSTRTTITYNQREDSQPANFSYFNVGQKWTLNWLGYVTDDPTNPGGSVSIYLAGGGAFYYGGYYSGAMTPRRASSLPWTSTARSWCSSRKARSPTSAGSRTAASRSTPSPTAVRAIRATSS